MPEEPKRLARGFVYSDEAVRLIKTLSFTGETIEGLSNALDVRLDLVSDIVRGREPYKSIATDFTQEEVDDLKKYGAIRADVSQQAKAERDRLKKEESEKKDQELREDTALDSPRRYEHLKLIANDMQKDLRSIDPIYREAFGGTPRKYKHTDLHEDDATKITGDLKEFGDLIQVFDALRAELSGYPLKLENLSRNFLQLAAEAQKAEGADRVALLEKARAGARGFGMDETQFEEFLKSDIDAWTPERFGDVFQPDFVDNQYANLRAVTGSISAFIDEQKRLKEAAKKPEDIGKKSLKPEIMKN